MSQDFMDMDSEIFADFIIEAKEHLETIEPNLLKLEKIPNDSTLLNDIFRPMHSLKGASGFLGLNKINKLAHRCENILDELRKETMIMTSEIMDVILSATDALGQIIENLHQSNTEGDVEIDHLTAQIDAIMANNAGTEQAEAPSAESVAEPEAKTESQEAASSVKNNLTPKEWIDSLTLVESYKLTAFGEGHLKDFIDESYEIIENLNAGLINLEELSDVDPELVNDLFRYFHNLKGNSSIIGFSQLNGLTHEAETLLNNIRRGRDKVTHELIDLLLFVTDVMESLIQSIDSASCSVEPFVVDELIDKLQDAIAGKSFALPGSNSTQGNDSVQNQGSTVVAALGDDDNDVFKTTISQQLEAIKISLKTLTADESDKNAVDILYLSLITIKNACAFLKLEDIQLCAERTASIVEGARKADIDFSIVMGMLDQECDIIKDMLEKVISEMPEAGSEQADSDAVAQKAASEDSITQTQDNAVRDELPQNLQPPVLAKSIGEKKESPKPVPSAESKPKTPEKTAPKSKAPAPTSAKAKAAAAAAAESGGNKGSSTIRVDHEKLDHLMNLIGELIINRNRYTLIARHLEEEENVDITQVAQNLTETTYAMARISDDLQDTIMKVRMVPVASVFSRFPRLVRDLSRKSGKEVDLILEGEETELDKSVVEVIGDPLVHLIRNSMDHGIEDEATRIARGKPVKGKVVLRAYHRGNSVAIEIEDDGKGIDPELMREVAVRKGVLDADAAKQLDDREAMELIFAPGFSSAETITDISGRGVGMDVVRTNIKNLKGSVTIASEVGVGTKFTLILPLTLAIIDALMVNVAGNLYALPLDAVSETTKIEAARLTDVKGRKAVTLRGEVIGIIELAEILCLPRKPLPELLAVVVIHDNSRRLGLVVDRLLERQEIVIKPLGSYLGDLRGISGATIMGDGSVILILDPHEIYSLSNSKSIT